MAPSADEHLARSDARAERLALGLDPLTGLPLRTAFFRECERVLAARAHDGRSTGLVVVRVLDTSAAVAHRGHAAVDAVLAAMGEALSRHTRGGDFVGRYAEDEFVILLPDETLLETHAVATRLRNCAESARVIAPGKIAPEKNAAGTSTFSMRVEVGVAAAPQHGRTADALLAAADAMVRRGTGGRLAA